MRIIRYPNKKFARVQAPASTIRLISAQPSRFPTSPLPIKQEQCLFTYAKAYYDGGGWWHIWGYAHDGSDVDRVLRIIDTAAGV